MGKKILIVDDEIHIRLLLAQTLEDLEDQSVELLFAENGLEAWSLVNSEQPDLIFLDVMLPQLSGLELCTRIKRDSPFQSTHVVILTSRGQDIDRVRSESAGADQYITKPFDPDQILELATRVLGLP